MMGEQTPDKSKVRRGGSVVAPSTSSQAEEAQQSSGQREEHISGKTRKWRTRCAGGHLISCMLHFSSVLDHRPPDTTHILCESSLLS